MKKSSMILALTLALSAWTATAQPSGDPPEQGKDGPPADGPHQGRHRPPPDSILIKALDANHDGVIDAGEIANAAAALKALDKNGDGQLTRDEYLPPRPDGGTNGPPPGPDGHRPPVPPIIAALDANGDGIIDATEMANASAALLKLDKNGDGRLTPDEWRPHRPRRDGPPPGEGGGNDNGAPGAPKEPPTNQ